MTRKEMIDGIAKYWPMLSNGMSDELWLKLYGTPEFDELDNAIFLLAKELRDERSS